MTISRALSLSFLLFFAFACATAKPDGDAERIDRFIRQAMTRFPEVPALGVGVVRDGKTILSRGYGLRDRERNLPADENTVFYIASSTKSYAGLLAATLAARGVVDLDAPIVRYLPELRFAPDVNAEKVTLRTLLTHTSGIDNDAIVIRTAFTGEHTPAQLIALLGRSKSVDPKFAYGNVGYVAAALVLERVTGKPWQDLLAEEVFAPLGMTHTTAYMSRAKEWPLARPYELDRTMQIRPLSFVKSDATMHAAGGIVTTPRDLARFLDANVNQRGLPSAAFAEAHKRQVDTPERDWYRFKRFAYALGWYHSDYEGTLMLHHFGGYEGWRAHVSFLPREKHGVAFVVNSGAPGSQLRDLLAAYAYDVLLGKPDLDTAYEAHLAKMRAEVDAGMIRMREELAKMAQRPPTLTRPRAAYTGRYASELYGTIVVREEGETLRASLGPLDAALEPYKERDTARVELVPGSGQVLRFVFEGGEPASALQLRDETFRRLP